MKLTGGEALVRWQHPEKGLISPNDFIPIAEETGLVIPLGEWVLKTACKHYQAWYAEGLDPGILAVNIDGQQIQRGGLFELVKEALGKSTAGRHGRLKAEAVSPRQP